MKVNKDYCMSSYLTFRYVYDKNICFKDGVVHHDHELISDDRKIPCKTAEEIDDNIRTILSEIKLDHVAVLLSGGMDSAILASYMPARTKAYTARCIGKKAIDETEQAKKYCDIYGLEHVVVDITWDDYVTTMDELMLYDGSPIIPNEPQAYKLAKIAKQEGATCIIYGDCADTEFGGMDRLLSKDWTFDEWVKRFSFTDMKKILKNPVDVSSVYELYRMEHNKIDFIRFIREVYTCSASGALSNACRCADIQSVDPYERLKMKEPLDLTRVRNGESKYLIRDLFRMRYPSLDVPEKLPMSRPADDWMKDWEGPVRTEFIPGCVKDLNGEQRLLVYSLERFLDLIDA